jgi:DNA-directed RNA polymerase specialized sigma24 family protein
MLSSHFLKTCFMETTRIFPECFSSAPFKLRSRFRKLDQALIDDSVQHASIQYWEKNIASAIPDPDEALGWFLCVAIRYLAKESQKLKKRSSIEEANNLFASDLDLQITFREYLHSLETLRIPTVLDHVAGYSLKEIAQSKKMSLDAIKQRHSRERRSIKKKADSFFYDFGRSSPERKTHNIPNNLY